jgi:hypothetical protein
MIDYVNNFRDVGFDGTMLKDILDPESANDWFDELSIEKKVHRKILTNKIKSLLQESESN